MVRCGEAGDPVGGGREFDAACGVAGFDREAGGEVGFAGSGWAEEDHALSGSDEVQRAQVSDLVAFDGGCVGEVEVLQGLAGGELRGFHAYLPAVRGVGGDFKFYPRG